MSGEIAYALPVALGTSKDKNEVPSIHDKVDPIETAIIFYRCTVRYGLPHTHTARHGMTEQVTLSQRLNKIQRIRHRTKYTTKEQQDQSGAVGLKGRFVAKITKRPTIDD